MSSFKKFGNSSFKKIDNIIVNLKKTNFIKHHDQSIIFQYDNLMTVSSFYSREHAFHVFTQIERQLCCPNIDDQQIYKTDSKIWRGQTMDDQQRTDEQGTGHIFFNI